MPLVGPLDVLSATKRHASFISWKKLNFWLKDYR
jgi:hypothetical protein